MRKIKNYLFITMLAFSLSFGGSVAYAAKSEELPVPEKGEEATVSEYGLLGFQNMHFDDGEVEEEGDGLSRGASYPSHYSSAEKGYVTSVKNQLTTGACWAFSAVSCIETDAIKNKRKIGGKKRGLSLDLSERHLVYFTYHPKNDPLNNNKGDKVTYTYSGQEFYRGGNSIMAAVSLANGEGPVYESVAPFSDNSVKASKDYQSLLSLMSMDMIFATNGQAQKNAKAIKKAILQNGACVFTIDYEFARNYDSTPENYYYPKSNSLKTNHDVTVVGWDDNYPASKFSEFTPPGDGAWLVKNSWGSAWGENGYFWYSYHDPGLFSAWAYTMSEKKYDNDYFYSNMPMIGDCGSRMHPGRKSTFANTYTIKASDTGYEKIEAVGFGVSNSNVKYEIELYANSKAGKPKSGKKLLKKATTGKLKYAGYHVVELKTPVYVKSGTDVTVLVTVKDCDGDTVFLWVDQGKRTDSYTEVANAAHYGYASIKHNAKIAKKKSVWSLEGVSGWLDIGNAYGETACINMYTDTPNTKIKSIASKGGKVSLSWNKTGGATGYKILRSEKKNKDYKEIKTVDSKTLKYTDKKVKKGKTYYYKVVPVKKIDGKALSGKKTAASSIKVKK